MSKRNELLRRQSNLSPAKRALLKKWIRGEHKAELDIIPQRPKQDRVPLSFAQARLWFLDQLMPGSPFYNVHAAVRLTGSLNLAALEYSFSEIVSRHETLRTTFTTVEGQPVQCITPALTLKLPLVDLLHISEMERLAEAQRLTIEEAQQPFDLVQGPLMRTTLLQISETEHILLLTMHHIISDGWSMGVLVGELGTLYEAFCDGVPSPLPELPMQYVDFAVWQRQWLSGVVLDTQLNYWRTQLHGAPSLLQLPTDRPRPVVQTYQGKTHSFTVLGDLTQKLQSLSGESGTTLFMTLLATFATLLYRYSGQSDILIGSPIANRNRSEIESLIGFFVNTLVLRTRFEDNPSFESLLAQVRETTLQAYEHQDVPFEQVVEALQPQRSLSHSPLFQVMFVWQNAPMGAVELPGVTLTQLDSQSTVAKFDLTLSMSETDQGLVGAWEYNTDLFDGETIERMAGHFQNLLLAIVENPVATVAELPLLSEAERHQLLRQWNDTQSEYPTDKCIHQLFESQVDKTPQAVAVVFENQQLTYIELNQRANQLAHHLQTLGVGPEVLVGICVERSVEMVIGLLGILKAGGAYVPLDPNYPQERLSYMLADSAVEVLLTQQQLLSSLPSHTARVVCLDREWNIISAQSEENPVNDTGASNLAYVIYTSGSTGNPKGVLIAHCNVVRLFAATQSWFNFNERDVWTFFHSYAFDFSVWEIWGALLYGGRLIVVPYLISRTPESFYKLLCKEKVTVLNQTPSAFGQLIQADKSLPQVKDLSLRLVIFGGEALSLESLKPWFEQHGDQLPQLVNMYGITETTVHVTYRPLTIADLNIKGSMIGSPMSDLQVYILDQNLQPTPIGVGGEMHIGGAGLAQGYLNRPELTCEKFIPNPFSNSKSERLYKTGDLARHLSDGNIEYLGRIDNQVKIRGFRIELGEIEAVLNNHPQIQQAVVIATEDIPGNKRLVAYVVSSVESLTTNLLREFLFQKLPDYMIPSIFVMLDTLPLTPSGKVNRRALPAPDTNSLAAEASFVSPRNIIEQQLAQIWADILNVHPVGVRDNFFNLGGHSLLAVQLMAQIQQQFGKNLSLTTLFQKPTIEQLATDLHQPTDFLPRSPLVALQPEGSKRPFFGVPGGDGLVGDFLLLARHLGPDQPFYGLQPLGLDGESKPHTRVEDMAAYYIDALQSIQPQGPYLLGGYCFGGLVAFEMAQQLQKQRHEVALLAFFDTVAPVPSSNQPTDVDGDDAALLIDIASTIERIFGKSLNVSYEDLKFLTLDEQLNYVMERLRIVNLLPPEAGLKQAHGLIQVIKASSQTRYVPQEVYPTQIVLFQPMEINYEEAVSKVPSEILREPEQGWRKVSAKPIDIHVVPGDHFTMLSEPHVQVLAEQLRACLEQVQANDSRT